MKLTRVVQPLLATLICAVALPTQAVPVTYNFSGVADSMGYTPGTEPFGGERPWQHVASGSFTLDLDYSTVRYEAEGRRWVGAAAPGFASFDVAMPTFSPVGSMGSAGSDCVSPYSTFGISDNHVNSGMPWTSAPSDQYSLYLNCGQQTASGQTLQHTLSIELYDWDPTPDMISGLDATQPLDLSLASLARFSLGYVLFDVDGSVESWTIGFNLDSLERATNVPEPATATLLVLGLAGCLVGRRRAVA